MRARLKKKLPDLSFLVYFFEDGKPVVCGTDHMYWPDVGEGICCKCGRRIVYSHILENVRVKLCVMCAPK